MASSVEVHKAAHEAFNRRDWDALTKITAESVTYKDQPRGLAMGSRDEFLGWLRE